LRELAELSPRWTLTGGAALVGFHLRHRMTRDLDLFWRSRAQLDHTPEEAKQRLVATGLEVAGLQSSATFNRLRVTDGAETCLVDLVAEPTPAIEPPQMLQAGPVLVAVDGRHEILVMKLCALLSRSELRDLEDVRALIAAGGNLRAAITDAPRKDAGFSALTMAWVLENFPVRALVQSEQRPGDEAEELERFRDWLIGELLATARSGNG
jgi:hypothetical protein